MRKKVLMSLVSLSLLVLLGGRSARAQIIGEVEADIPFNFYAGNARLPAGKYIIKVLDDSDLSLMEIRNKNGRMSALFQVRDSIDNVNPSKSELLFNKYGDQYFLSKIYEEGEKDGSAVAESRYEMKMEKSGVKAETRSVPCRRHSGQAMKTT